MVATARRDHAKSNDNTAGTATAAAPTWRHLPFYDVGTVRDADDFAQTPAILQRSADVAAVVTIATCPAFAAEALSRAKQDRETSTAVARESARRNGAVSGQNHENKANAPLRSFLLIGTSRGKVSVCDGEDYRHMASFDAFVSRQGTDKEQASSSSKSNQTFSAARTTHMATDVSNRLYTIGEDDGVPFPLLRIWDLNICAMSAAGQPMPRLLGEIRVQHGSKPHPVSALAITSAGTFLAVGLADGTVLLLRGLKETLSAAPKWQAGSNARKAAVNLQNFKVAHQSPSSGEISPVTALGFSEQSSALQPIASKERTAARKGPQHRAARSRKGMSEPDESSRDPTAIKSQPGAVFLFIISLTKILRYTVIGKGMGSPATNIDDVGCALGCAAMLPAHAFLPDGQEAPLDHGDKLVVARDEAIYVIGHDGREMTLAFEGKKASIRLVQSQLVIISPPLNSIDMGIGPDASIGRERIARLDSVSGRTQRYGDRNQDAASLTVFDLDDKFVAFSAIFEGGIREVWKDGLGDICVLSDDARLTRLSEKPLRQKLDLLFRKSLFLLAIGVARSHIARSRSYQLLNEQNKVDAVLCDIHRRYGEHLYEKGDFEGAIGQFVQTIGITQPSYVIRKFLDAQRIRNLTTYLQELHARGYANSDHTTLLLNCYAKLKDVAALDKFIHRPVHNSNANDREHEENTSVNDDEQDEQFGELPFDLDTAINVCRQGGYYEHAAYLAQHHGRPDEYVNIQIEDRADFKEATEYIRTLKVDDARRIMLRYGSTLLSSDAARTTDLLIALCSGAFQPVPMAIGTGVDASKVENKSAAAYLSYLQVGRLVKSAPANASGSKHAATASPSKASEAVTSGTDANARFLQDLQPPPTFEDFLPHFVNHKPELIRFLESLALTRWDQHIDLDAKYKTDAPLAEPTVLPEENDLGDQENDQREQENLWNTLLELYIAPMDPSLAEKENLGHRKALALLRQHNSLPYDIARALVCCAHEHFNEGKIYLLERLGMYEDIVRESIESEVAADTSDDKAAMIAAGEQLIQALDRFGPSMPHLYPLVLQHLVEAEPRIKRHESDVERILSLIFAEQLLSPLEVVQMLSRSRVAPVSLLRGHLLHVLQAQQADIATNASLTATYRDETREKQRDIAALHDPEQTRVFQQTRCNVCHGQLDLPSVHFMCRHSFHARCLGAGENECPVCAKSHATILEIRRNNVAFGQRHDLFIEEVEEAEDGFDVVANMFSKGLFDPQLLGTQQNASQ